MPPRFAAVFLPDSSYCSREPAPPAEAPPRAVSGPSAPGRRNATSAPDPDHATPPAMSPAVSPAVSSPASSVRPSAASSSLSERVLDLVGGWGRTQQPVASTEGTCSGTSPLRVVQGPFWYAPILSQEWFCARQSSRSATASGVRESPPAASAPLFHTITSLSDSLSGKGRGNFR